MALRCSVVVDRLSVEHSLKDADKPTCLDLLRLLYWFRASGLEPVEIAVAAAFVPAVRGAGGKPDVARQVASDTVRWFDQQVAQVAVAEPSIRVAPLFGAHNGQREVAVDLAVAAAALEAAGDNGPEDIDLVVICSKDSGFHHLYRYARRVPILLAASFTDADCKHLLLGEVPLIQIPAGDAAQFASEARGKVTSSLSQGQLGDQQRSARFGSGQEGDEVLVDQSAVVQSGAQTRMQAHLPPRSRGSQGMHDEWIARDSGVDDLGESHESEESPFTQAHQIELLSEQANEVANGLSDRHIAASASKRLAIALLADIFFAVHTAPHAAHVLLGEDSDLIAALELLPLCGIHTYSQVVRVALDACTDRLELGGEAPVAKRVKSLVRRAGPAGDLVASGGGKGKSPWTRSGLGWQCTSIATTPLCLATTRLLPRFSGVTVKGT